jgi:hypothetical protein
MSSSITRLASGMGLALCLGIAFTPLGCGSSQEFPAEPPRQAQEGPTAPESTVALLTECAKRGAAHLTDTHYAILFDVDVNGSGSVGEARVRDSMLPDREMEACMVGALEAMSVPRSVMAMRSSHRVSGGKVSPESRAYMGDVSVVGGAIVNLVPILVVIAGVTVLVGVTLYVAEYIAEETAEAVRRRRTKVERKCYPPLYQCLGYHKQPEWNREIYGDDKDCGACFRQCIREGEWPDKKCPPPDYRPN